MKRRWITTAYATATMMAASVPMATAQSGAATLPGASLLAADRAAAERTASAGLIEAVRRALAPDGIVLWPGAPVAVGRDAMTLLAAQRVLDSVSISWQPLGIRVSSDTSLGLTWGVLAWAQSREAPKLGRYTIAWRRDAGEWRIAALLVDGIARPRERLSIPPGIRPERPPLTPAGATRPASTADLAFATLAGDSGAAVAFGRYAAPDVVMTGDGGVLAFGPRSAAALVDGPASWRWHPVAAGASHAGDLAWTVGEAVISPQGGQPRYSKYLTVWARQPDGAMRFIIDGGNSRPAPG